MFFFQIRRDYTSLLSSPSSPSVKKTPVGGKKTLIYSETHTTTHTGGKKQPNSSLKSGSAVSQASADDHHNTTTDPDITHTPLDPSSGGNTN